MPMENQVIAMIRKVFASNNARAVSEGAMVSKLALNSRIMTSRRNGPAMNLLNLLSPTSTIFWRILRMAHVTT